MYIRICYATLFGDEVWKTHYISSFKIAHDLDATLITIGNWFYRQSFY